MRTTLSVIIVVAGCCLAFSPEAKASRIYGNTDIYYDASQNRMVGYAETTSTYSAGAYYCTYVSVLLEAGGQGAYNSALDGCHGGYSRAEATLPYDPNAEYTVEGEHEGDPYYRDDMGRMIDYYNFQVYMEGVPVYYPLTYQFIGPGPRRPAVGSILLGMTSALFSLGTRHGPPHHLKVLYDNSINRTEPPFCGQIERQITYQIVDVDGRSAGFNSIKESFPETVTSSCTGYTVSPSGCRQGFVSRAGIFTDQIRVGCHPSGLNDPACGFDIYPQRWVWCPRGKPEKVLAAMETKVHHLRITTDSLDEWPDGRHIYGY